MQGHLGYLLVVRTGFQRLVKMGQKFLTNFESGPFWANVFSVIFGVIFYIGIYIIDIFIHQLPQVTHFGCRSPIVKTAFY